jgi:hypothetical protein
LCRWRGCHLGKNSHYGEPIMKTGVFGKAFAAGIATSPSSTSCSVPFGIGNTFVVDNPSSYL